MKVGVWSGRMLASGMAALAKEGHLSDKKLGVVAPVGFMTGKAVLRHRRMLPHERPSLFGMAFVTELIDRIRL
jgi:hypothetical protein